MNGFKVEFSQLLLRYTSSDGLINNSTSILPTSLTNQQILDAIRDVLHSTLNINLQNIETSTLKTPINEIVITTPHAPDISRVDYNDNFTLKSRYRSSEFLYAENEDDYHKLFNHRLSLDQNEASNVSNNESEAKNENALSEKSEEEQKEIFVEKQINFDQLLKEEVSTIEPVKKNNMYKIVEEAHKNAIKVMNKIENLRELLMPESRPIRRLSVMMSLPGTKQQHLQTSVTNSSNLRSMQRSKALRRSLHQLNDDMSATPTSRLSLPPQSSQLQVNVKKCNGNVKVLKPVSKPPSGQQNRSVIALTLMESNKSAAVSAIPKSPSKNIGKIAKYAHVQSTIPKPVSSAVKRKS